MSIIRLFDTKYPYALISDQEDRFYTLEKSDVRLSWTKKVFF
jgi:hypothetical protein